MSLDFVVLGANGAPEKSARLGVDLHHELITTASAVGLDCFNTFADYYEDAQIASDQLSKLEAQCRILRKHSESVQLREFLDELVALVDVAKKRDTSLHVIAD